MIENSMDIPVRFPIRKTRKQKKAFRESVCLYLESMGYPCVVEKVSMGCSNVVAGDPERAQHLICAHYDTPTAVPLIHYFTPCNFWLFLGYQLLLTVALLVPSMLVFLVVWLITKSLYWGIGSFMLTMLVTVLWLNYGPGTRYTANNNTSGVVTLLEIAKSMPKSCKDDVCFVLFDQKEQAMAGSAAYYQEHGAACRNQLVWNLDSVGQGDEILFFPSSMVRKDSERVALLSRCETELATKRIRLYKNRFRYFPSDHKNFPFSVGITALRKNRFGLYQGNMIHLKDDCLDETNVNILRAAIVSAISCQGVR